MPNRILRERSLTSKTLNSVSAEAERLFFRLTLVADDTGRFEADPRIILARCFPLKVDELKSSTVAKWYAELEGVGAVVTYETCGSIYGYFPKWQDHQRLRNSKPKYPGPDDAESRQVAASCGELPRVAARARARPESESEPESETETESECSTRVEREFSQVWSKTSHHGLTKPQAATRWPGFVRFWAAYPRRVGKLKAWEAWLKMDPPEGAALAAVEASRRNGWKDPKFIPHPASWLHAGRWEDEVTYETPGALAALDEVERQCHGNA